MEEINFITTFKGIRVYGDAQIYIFKFKIFKIKKFLFGKIIYNKEKQKYFFKFVNSPIGRVTSLDEDELKQINNKIITLKKKHGL